MKINLANLAQSTEQQVFDQVAKHLLAQNAKSIDGEECHYRLGGLSCAAGCLIGDSEYSEGLEGRSWLLLVHERAVPSAHDGLIDKLQCLHDCFGPMVWRERLTALADIRGLNKEVLK